jgi:hypothetical protein
LAVSQPVSTPPPLDSWGSTALSPCLPVLLSPRRPVIGTRLCRLGLFDVAKANSFEEVVEALVSNTEERTDEVTLIFERAL